MKPDFRSDRGKRPASRMIEIAHRLAHLVLPVTAIAVHLVLASAPGWERDLYWFDTWMRLGVQHGAPSIRDHVWCDYPPGYLYVLSGTGAGYQAVTGSLPSEGSMLARYLIKLPPIVANLITAWFLMTVIAGRNRRKLGLLAFVCYAFNPALLVNGAIWGQADSLIGLLGLLSAWWVIERRYLAAFGALTTGMLVKFQLVAIMPPLLIAALYRDRWRAFRGAWFGGLGAWFLMLWPYFQAGKASQVAEVALSAVDRYPVVSMNAYNVWWLAFGESSSRISDAHRWGNATYAYHDIGMFLLSIATVLICWRLLVDLRGGTRAGEAILRACALQALAFYLLPTQMHERYVIPAVALLAGAALFQRSIWPLYLLVSITCGGSLASTLRAHYPNGLGIAGTALDRLGLSPALFPASRADGYVFAASFTLTFLLLLAGARNRRYRRPAIAFILIATLVFTGAGFMPKPGSIALSEWRPVERYQQWGALSVNRTVSGNRLENHGYIFRKGLGTHARSWLVYHLNGRFERFETCFGFDSGIKFRRAQFRIYAGMDRDRPGDWKPLFDSGVISANQPPRYAGVRLDGAEWLGLQVLDGHDGTNSDHVVWYNPVLYRRPWPDGETNGQTPIPRLSE